VLSKTVSTSLKFLETYAPENIARRFAGSGPTQNYLMMANNFFDATNRRHTGKGITAEEWPRVKQVKTICYLLIWWNK